ncbi:MAG: hypothetical protein AAF909_14265 [Pseudomonadota bacterium]
MQKTLIAAALAAAFAFPAAAAVTTVEFTPSEGEKQTWKFNDQTGKATGPTGKEYDYTFDEEARKLCATLDEGELCATFTGEEQEAAVGATAEYTASNGATGSATILAIEE